MSLRGCAVDAGRMCLVAACCAAQVYLFPCYLVLACTAAYVLFCGLHAASMLTRDAGTVPFPLLIHGHAPAGYVLTIANTLLLYELVYIAGFLHSSSRDGRLCGRMYPAGASCAAAAGPNATSLTFCSPKTETSHAMLAVDHTPVPLDCVRHWQCHAVGTALHGAVVLQPLPPLEPRVVFTPAATPPRAPPGTQRRHDEQSRACRPLGAVALYPHTALWRPVHASCHASGEYTAAVGGHLPMPLYVAVPRSARVGPRLVTQQPRTQPLLALLDRAWDRGADSLRLTAITVACAAAAGAYVAAFNAFQSTVRHTASALFLYVCVPMGAFFAKIGSWASLAAAVLLASCIVKCSPARKLTGLLAGALALLESAYLAYVALAGHLYTDLQWQSARSHMHTLSTQSALVDDIFWGNRRDSFEVFLFYPGLLLSVFCGISAVGAALTA